MILHIRVWESSSTPDFFCTFYQEYWEDWEDWEDWEYGAVFSIYFLVCA